MSSNGKIPRRVLVIEDDEAVVELLQNVLVAAGFDVIAAENAVDGLSLYKRYCSSTLCVILDYGIPGMHAARLLQRFHEIDEDVKVILSSGYPQQFIREDFPLDRIVGFIPKPYMPQTLLGELSKLSA